MGSKTPGTGDNLQRSNTTNINVCRTSLDTIPRKKCNRDKYVRVQRLILTRIAKAYRTISHEALCIITGITPIDIKAREVVALYNIKTGKRTTDRQIDLPEKPMNWLHPAEFLGTGDSNENALWQIYTDGSESTDGIGAGIAIYRGNQLINQLKFKLHDECSNNQAEQLAITKALEFLETKETDNTEHNNVTLHTDSRITIDSIADSNNHNQLIERIRRKTAILNTKNWKIQFKWVKAHVGIQGNELADKLAKEGAKTSQICYDRPPISTIKYQLRRETENEWQQRWEDTSKGTITKEFFPTVGSRLITRINLTPNLTTIVTGHGNINSYLHRLKIASSPECSCGRGPQTVEHIIFKCSEVKSERESLVNSVQK